MSEKSPTSLSYQGRRAEGVYPRHAFRYLARILLIGSLSLWIISNWKGRSLTFRMNGSLRISTTQFAIDTAWFNDPSLRAGFAAWEYGASAFNWWRQFARSLAPGIDRHQDDLGGSFRSAPSGPPSPPYIYAYRFLGFRFSPRPPGLLFRRDGKPVRKLEFDVPFWLPTAIFAWLAFRKTKRGQKTTGEDKRLC